MSRTPGRRLLPSLILAGSSLMAGLASEARAGESPEEALEDARKRVFKVEKALVGALDKVRRSSVTVFVKRYPGKKGANGLRGEPVLVGGGSGVIVSLAGFTRSRAQFVITNHHVIEHGHVLSVVDLKGVEHRVTLRDTVAQYDIALLEFSDKPKGLTAVRVKKAGSQKLEEGAWVLATGNPFFLGRDGRSVSTLGVVSGLERVLGGRFVYGSAIQHDAEVNPGNSGGPLWNLSGDLVGINGMIRVRPAAGGPTNTGASFSIPVYQITPFLKTLVDASKDAQSGYLGLQLQTSKNKKGQPDGALVTKVLGNSPCRQKHGGSKYVQGGDVVLQFTAKASGRTKKHVIRTASDLINALVLYQAGTKVSLKVRRKRKVFTWSGALGRGG